METELATWWADWIDLGPWILAPVCALAATLIPLSSELVVLAAVANGADPLAVFLWASLGNCVGATSSYLLGRWVGPSVLTRLARSRSGRGAIRWVERWGVWAMLGTWLPVIGDPLMIAAGVFRLPAWSWVALGLGMRVLRYALLV